jgi:hypothetical protein
LIAGPTSEFGERLATVGISGPWHVSRRQKLCASDQPYYRACDLSQSPPPAAAGADESSPPSPMLSRAR